MIVSYDFDFPDDAVADITAAFTDHLGEDAGGLTDKQIGKAVLKRAAKDIYVRYKRRVDGPAATAALRAAIDAANGDIAQALVDIKAAEEVVRVDAEADFADV